MQRILVAALLFLSGPLVVSAQITSSANLSCTVVALGSMGCNGISVPDENAREKKVPRLSVTHFIVKPGAALDQKGYSSDCLIIGMNGGALLNEEAPFLHVSLAKDNVTLMPKEQPFRLRNDGREDVEFQLIRIER